jgi:phosphonate transport system substrate-binding protein
MLVPPALAQDKIVIAIQPTLSSDEMLKKAKPLEKFIKDGLGGKTDVQVYVPSSFAAVVESLRFGHAHVAFMSAWPAQLAVQLGGAEVALAEVREVIQGAKKVEAPYYYSYWVVPSNSLYQNLQSLKGKTACFPSPISTSGYVAPMGTIVGIRSYSACRRERGRAEGFFQGRRIRRWVRAVLASAKARAS